MRALSRSWLLVLTLVAGAMVAAACSNDDPPRPLGGEFPIEFTADNFPDLSSEELDYLIDTNAAWELFSDKNDRFLELFQQTWPLPELLLQALYDAGAGTAFLDTVAALEALDPPQRFADDHVIAVQRAQAAAEVDALIGEAVKAGDAVAFWRLNSGLAAALRPFTLALSNPVCIANGAPELCDREEFPAGSYQHDLNTAIRVMESGLRATTASLPPNMGLTPTDIMQLMSEQSPRVVDLFEAAAASVDSLTPPDALRAEHDRLTSYLHTSVVHATDSGLAAEAGDLDAFEAVQTAFVTSRCAVFEALESSEFSAIVASHIHPLPPCAPPPPA